MDSVRALALFVLVFSSSFLLSLPMSSVDFYRQLLAELGYCTKGTSWTNPDGDRLRLVIATSRRHTILAFDSTQAKAWAKAVHFARAGS